MNYEDIDNGPWTHFMDMHSGGRAKDKFEHCYIQANKKMAIKIFRIKFGHDPEKVACSCCGENYSIHEGESLSQLSAFYRNCKWTKSGHIEKPEYPGKRVIPINEYCVSDGVKVISDSEITLEEKISAKALIDYGDY